MLNKAKRRASRVGFSTTKFILSIDFIQLQLMNSEGLLPSGSLMSISLERGSKCVATEDKLFRYEDKEANPLKSNPSNSNNNSSNLGSQQAVSMLVNLLQRLELVATLYKEPGHDEFQEKDAIIKLRVTKKDKKNVFAMDNSIKTIGFHTLKLNEMIARLHAKKISSNPTAESMMYTMMEEETFLVLHDMPQGCGLKVHVKLIPLASMGNGKSSIALRHVYCYTVLR